MAKQVWKPGNMLYPLPVVMASVGDKAGNSNIITIAWTGTVCSDPAMLYISVRPERFSHHMIMETGEFVVNLTTEALVKATDYCGVRSGKDIVEVKSLGSHDMFLAEVVAVQVDEKFLNENGRFCLDETELLAYSHGDYLGLGEKLGQFGYSVKKK